MSKFENVSVVKAANVYFDGKVTSRTVEFANGDVKTLGIMLPGDYRFGTAKKEIMEILSADEGTKNDIPRWCEKVGHEYLGFYDEDSFSRLFLIKE